MHTISLIIENSQFDILDMQHYLQSSYPSYEIDGISSFLLENGEIELRIESKFDMEGIVDEVINEISRFTPSDKESEAPVLSEKELTDLVLMLCTKLVEEKVINMDALSTLPGIESKLDRLSVR